MLSLKMSKYKNVPTPHYPQGHITMLNAKRPQLKLWEISTFDADFYAYRVTLQSVTKKRRRKKSKVVRSTHRQSLLAHTDLPISHQPTNRLVISYFPMHPLQSSFADNVYTCIHYRHYEFIDFIENK